VRRVDGRAVVDLRGDASHRVVLRACELLRHVRTDQVRAADRPEEHRPTGEDPDLVPLGVEQHVREVGRRVAGGEERADPHEPALEHVAVPQTDTVEPHRVGGVEAVGGIEHRRERVSPGDVVVVHVCLDDVRDVEAVLVQHVQDAVDVALRVDHDGVRAVVRDVAAVTERSRLDRDDADHAHPCPRVPPCCAPRSAFSIRNVKRSPSSLCSTNRFPVDAAHAGMSCSDPRSVEMTSRIWPEVELVDRLACADHRHRARESARVEGLGDFVHRGPPGRHRWQGSSGRS
jgi:hypothetical protein